jgi:hypothetical protein
MPPDTTYGEIIMRAYQLEQLGEPSGIGKVVVTVA